ncbi:10870_t:CDS:2 [Entrophospora sp. SA101]|nr:10870_t:CDS:2 [Entrophospora sp. SA101]
MSGWESLYEAATSDYRNGDLNDSYSNYLKTANALLHKLNHEVAFINRDSIKSKPHNSVYLFNRLKTCVQRLEDILQNKVILGNLSSPQPSCISDLVKKANKKISSPMHLPLVPFSPLTKKAIHYAQELIAVTSQVAGTKQCSNDNENSHLASLRKLNEKVRQIRSKLDQVNNQIQSIAELALLSWDADSVAQQLTIIESNLFGKIDFRNDLKTKDKKNSKVQACLDFHRYLTNSFTHQFIIFAENSKTFGNPSRLSYQRENIIAHAIRIAYYLLNVHRNFNSFAAIMKALSSLEVRRIRRLWSGLPTRMNQILKDLYIYIKKEDNEYKSYKEILVQKLDLFREIGQGMVVIPWIQPHYEEIKQIKQSYATGKSNDSSEIVLSPPGARKLLSIYSLLEQCQSNTISQDNDDEHFNNRKVTNTPPIRSAITIDGTSTVLPLDLSCLGFGNLDVHHWLVSRVYLNKQQLIDESIFIEPLSENEQIPYVLSNENETKISQSVEFNDNELTEFPDKQQSFLSKDPFFDRNESSPKLVIDGVTSNNSKSLISFFVSKSTDNPIVHMEPIEDNYFDNSTKSFSNTTSLNPNAQEFVPLSFSPAPGPLPDGDKSNFSNKPWKTYDPDNKSDDENSTFVYPNSKSVISAKDHFVYNKDDNKFEYSNSPSSTKNDEENLQTETALQNIQENYNDIYKDN